MQRSLTLAALTLMLAGTAIAQTSAPRARPVTTIPNTQVKPGELANGNANLVGKMFSQPFTLSAADRAINRPLARSS